MIGIMSKEVFDMIDVNKAADNYNAKVMKEKFDDQYIDLIYRISNELDSETFERINDYFDSLDKLFYNVLDFAFREYDI